MHFCISFLGVNNNFAKCFEDGALSWLRTSIQETFLEACCALVLEGTELKDAASLLEDLTV